MDRIRIGKVEPAGYKAIVGLHEHVEAAVDQHLNDLVKLRASQINGCAYCIDEHWREARERAGAAPVPARCLARDAFLQ